MDDESGILAYLSSGTEIFSAMGAERDVVTGDEWIPGAGSLVTDGTWMWPIELHHYVKRYHAELPEDFLATMRSTRYTAPAVSRDRVEEIVRDVFGGLPFATGAGGKEGADGFFSWYLSYLTSQSSSRLLESLEAAGLKARHPLTGDISLFRTGKDGGDARLVRDSGDLADVLADPGHGEVALHLWFASDTFTILRVRRLDDETTVVVHELSDLQEPEREQVVAALVQTLDQLRDSCRGFVLDRAGLSPHVAWDSVICEGASPTAPLPDSVAVDATRFAQLSGFDTMTRTTYGHLAVFSRRSTEGARP
ncbi:hypothetical protein [Streptomyces sp. SLBN-118]|uniref:hypothetical protein n=1 Tax=Streptomyces sp. SLBN-118 TaxID=2768454 RepID=UPI00114F1F06|nr:hypothetical protein [Streptomyces sp. SLBN-118]